MIAQKNLINQKLITLVSNFFLSSLLIVIYTMPVFSGDSDFEKIKRSAEAGISKSQFELGTIYLEGKYGVRKSTEAAVKWVRLAASTGDPKAQILLADLIRRGEGVQKDINEAIIWYKLAAENKNPEAYASLGQVYLEGDGVVKNISEAIKWLKLGAKSGDPYSQIRLGDSYLAGRGRKK